MRTHVIAAATIALASIAGAAAAAPAQAETRSVFVETVQSGAGLYGAPNGQLYGYTGGQIEAWCFKMVDQQVWISVSQFQDLWVHREELVIRPNAVPSC